MQFTYVDEEMRPYYFSVCIIYLFRHWVKPIHFNALNRFADDGYEYITNHESMAVSKKVGLIVSPHQ